MAQELKPARPGQERNLAQAACFNPSFQGLHDRVLTPHRKTPPLTISQPVYEQFQRLIYNETGIWLANSKKALLCGRLAKRLRALQLETLADYHQLVSQPEQHLERVQMIDCITTNETHFFREPKHFEFLSQEIVPRWRARVQQGLRSKAIRIWSAGCSSGEEPYSLAMLLAHELPVDRGWDVQVLGSDISTRVLAKARKGIYRLEKSADIPKVLLHRFMLKGVATQEGQMKVSQEIQQGIQFTRLNLSQGPFPIGAAFDLIFCRNVLIYFDNDSKRKVVNNLAKCLSPDGFFLIGHAENLSGISLSLRSLAPTIYCKAESHSRLAGEFQR